MARIRIDDPDLPLADLMSEWPQTIHVFLRHGMLCVGCLVSPIHTVTDACAAYDLDEDSFLRELRQAAELA
jgi:hybrid cluster-associated redox disulfide protein